MSDSWKQWKEVKYIQFTARQPDENILTRSNRGKNFNPYCSGWLLHEPTETYLTQCLCNFLQSSSHIKYTKSWALTDYL